MKLIYNQSTKQFSIITDKRFSSYDSYDLQDSYWNEFSDICIEFVTLENELLRLDNRELYAVYANVSEYGGSKTALINAISAAAEGANEHRLVEYLEDRGYYWVDFLKSHGVDERDLNSLKSSRDPQYQHDFMNFYKKVDRNDGQRLAEQLYPGDYADDDSYESTNNSY